MLSSALKSFVINIAFRCILVGLFVVALMLTSIILVGVAVVSIVVFVFGIVYFDDVENTYKIKVPFIEKYL